MRQPRIRRIYMIQLRNKFCEMQDLNNNPIILLVYRLFEQSEEIYENREIFLFENAKNPFPVNDDARTGEKKTTTRRQTRSKRSRRVARGIVGRGRGVTKGL